DSVEMIGEGSLGVSGSESVWAPKISLEEGHYAFWISGEQTKALVNIGYEKQDGTAEFPETISRQYQFAHLNLGGDPSTSESISRSLSFDQVALALDVDESELKEYYFDLTTHSRGLFTDARQGGLKLDLTALLSMDDLPDGYDGEPIYSGYETIEADNWATQSPTWNYLKAYYDLRLDVLDDGMLTPQTGTKDRPGISPVIAMFKMGFGGGLSEDNYLLVNLYPQLILYNPYSVPLKGRDYTLILYGNQMTRTEDLESGSSVAREYRSMPIAVGHEAAHNQVQDNPRYEIGKAFVISDGTTTTSDVSIPTDADPPYVTKPANNPPGAPRFLVECPDITPGAAVIFSLDTQTDFDRYSMANVSLKPGFQAHPFTWKTLLPLHENTDDPAELEYFYWTLFDPQDYPVYSDAALVDDASADDVLLSLPGSSTTRGIQRVLYRRDDEDFESHVFQMTGRIPFRKSEYTYPTSDSYYFYGIPVSDPGVEFGWAAYAFAPTSGSNSIHAKPFAQFNPRAKDLDPINIDNDDGDHQHYFYNMYGGIDFPILETYDSDTKVYFGGGYTQADGGVKSFVLYDVPQDEIGLYSLGQLQHMQVSEHFDEAGYAIGNSWASPHIPRDQYYSPGSGVTSQESLSTGDYIGDIDYSSVDLSYLLNQALWDRTFFSTIQNVGESGDNEFHQPVNPRYDFNSQFTAESFSDPESNAAEMHIDGAFNDNSVTVYAWLALLSGLHGAEPEPVSEGPSEYPFFRMIEPTGDSSDIWAGFRDLTAEQIRELAEFLVEEIKSRGPFLSLADFVNRSLVAAGDDSEGHGLMGALQSAIEKAGINEDLGGEEITTSNVVAFDVPEHATGKTSDGIAGYLTQADVLTAIGPLLTVRDDTFTIRSYGDFLNPVTGEVESEVWCEAVVQRLPDYVLPEKNNPEDQPEILSAENQMMGRQYEIVSLRWLNPNEI
ncbi:MAG: hypothetical protein ACQKBT_01990, partial [Puniceicoccales bacterium]